MPGQVIFNQQTEKMRQTQNATGISWLMETYDVPSSITQ